MPAHAKSVASRARPRCARRAAAAGSSRTRPTAPASAATSPAGNDTPVTPSTTISASPPDRAATSGAPAATASSATMPNGSDRLRRTTAAGADAPRAPPRRGRPQRGPGGPRLQRDDAERLVPARQDDGVGGRDRRGELGVGQAPGERDVVGDAVVAGPRGEHLALRARADDD